MSDRLKVLIVDDDKADRLAIRHVLRGAPFEMDVAEAETSADCMRRLARRDIGCVIVDNRLAGEFGLDLLRAIRREEADRGDAGGLPVIMLTGRGDEGVAVQAMKAGATDYVPKAELTTDRLSSAIRTGIEIHERRADAARASAELQRAHDQLEQRVRQRTAELEQANRELVRRNAELDEFTYVASHDLQEPLRKLVAFSNLLPSDVGRDLPDVAQKDLDFITGAARRMQALVQDLLALSRAGKSAMKREPVRLDACADAALKALAARVEETAAMISRDKLPVVLGDETLLTQVYQNLIGNALKFVASGRRPRIRLTADRRSGGWVLGVRDNGIGIKPEYLDQIFAPFKRLHGRDEFEGTGIGLSVCRKVVERHGGKLWVESKPDQGAHFKFTLHAESRSRDAHD